MLIQAALLALSGRNTYSYLVEDTRKKLNKAASQKKVTLNWTKAHVGTCGNELADEAAKGGLALTTPLTCLLYTSPSPRDWA